MQRPESDDDDRDIVIQNSSKSDQREIVDRHTPVASKTVKKAASVTKVDKPTARPREDNEFRQFVKAFCGVIDEMFGACIDGPKRGKMYNQFLSFQNHTLKNAGPARKAFTAIFNSYKTMILSDKAATRDKWLREGKVSLTFTKFDEDERFDPSIELSVCYNNVLELDPPDDVEYSTKCFRSLCGVFGTLFGNTDENKEIRQRLFALSGAIVHVQNNMSQTEQIISFGTQFMGIVDGIDFDKVVSADNGIKGVMSAVIEGVGKSNKDLIEGMDPAVKGFVADSLDSLAGKVTSATEKHREVKRKKKEEEQRRALALQAKAAQSTPQVMGPVAPISSHAAPAAAAVIPTGINSAVIPIMTPQGMQFMTPDMASRFMAAQGAQITPEQIYQSYLQGIQQKPQTTPVPQVPAAAQTSTPVVPTTAPLTLPNPVPLSQAPVTPATPKQDVLFDFLN